MSVSSPTPRANSGLFENRRTNFLEVVGSGTHRAPWLRRSSTAPSPAAEVARSSNCFDHWGPVLSSQLSVVSCQFQIVILSGARSNERAQSRNPLSLRRYRPPGVLPKSSASLSERRETRSPAVDLVGILSTPQADSLRLHRRAPPRMTIPRSLILMANDDSPLPLPQILILIAEIIPLA
jgi:hypothetical protein